MAGNAAETCHNEGGGGRASKTVALKWTGSEDSSLATSFFIDDQAVTLG